MIYNFFAKTIVRAGLILFWILIFAFFIYFSPITNLLFKPARFINVASWADFIDEESVREFEKKTGITVYHSFYENNEELLSKLKLTESQGYDLVIPTDWTVQTLIKYNMLKKLDKSKLKFWNELDPRLLNHYFDPHNQYSIPYNWDILGIGYDKNYFKKPPPHSWSLLFDEKVTPGHVGMTDDPREVVMIAAQYLFGTTKDLAPHQLEEVEQLLLKQKEWVESYSDLRGEFLLYSKTSPVAMIPSNQVWGGVRTGQFTNIGLIIPKNAFMLIDSVVIPKSSENTDLVYEFINFLYQKHIYRLHTDEYGFLPSRKDLMDEHDNSHMLGAENLSHMKSLKRFSFFANTISREDLNKIWLAVKAA